MSDQIWQCPICEYFELQPPAVTDVAHRCPYRGGRLTALAPVDPEDA